jgi:hypothetical protein
MVHDDEISAPEHEQIAGHRSPRYDGLSIGAHSLKERLARWLLMMRDRGEEDTLNRHAVEHSTYPRGDPGESDIDMFQSFDAGMAFAE